MFLEECGFFGVRLSEFGVCLDVWRCVWGGSHGQGKCHCVRLAISRYANYPWKGQ